MNRQEQPDFEAIQQKMENPEAAEIPVPVEIPEKLTIVLNEAVWGVLMPCTGEHDAQNIEGANRFGGVVISKPVMNEIRQRINGYEELLLGSLAAQETIEDLRGDLVRALEGVRILNGLSRLTANNLDRQKLWLLTRTAEVVAQLDDLLEEKLKVSDVIPPEKL